MKKILGAIVRGLSHLMSGEILADFKVGHYLPQIFCVVVTISLYIVLGIFIDATLSTVEKNKLILEDLKIELSLKTKTYTAQRKLENVERVLRERSTDIGLPKKPATRIE
ncbi:MAG: hypothetical protein J6Y32_01450 [Bacteroidales bacterium]|nr:hypothetical protein [Bacteroidales bacterium]